VVSNFENLDFGIVACRRSLPHVQNLIGYMEEALVELEQGAGLRTASGRPRRRKKKAARAKTKKTAAAAGSKSAAAAEGASETAATTEKAAGKAKTEMETQPESAPAAE
jgi:diacylglycerol O-acyltransferase